MACARRRRERIDIGGGATLVVRAGLEPAVRAALIRAARAIRDDVARAYPGGTNEVGGAGPASGPEGPASGGTVGQPTALHARASRARASGANR